jgi:hypothetical protein
VALLLCLLNVHPALADRRIALVLGNSNYQHAPALSNPVTDAQAMAAKFRQVGFDVVSAHFDVGNLQFKRAIREFETAAATADVAVIYYAGHGIEINGENYLIPVDAILANDRDADDEAVTVERVAESISGAKQLRLIILDACRDNPFVRTMKRPQNTALRGITRGLSVVEASGVNMLIAYAAKAGSTAEDGEAEHSPLTTALLNGLFGPGLDIRLAFGRVRDEVLDKTGNRQEPFVYGSIGGASVALVPAVVESVSPTENLEVAKADYLIVEKIGTKAAWESFLVQYPTGFYADLARQQLAKFEASQGTKPTPPSPDDATWFLLKETTDEEALKRFAEQYPDSPLRKNAEARIAALEAAQRAKPVPPSAVMWRLLKETTHEEALKRFAEQYPDSPLRKNAEARIATLKASAAPVAVDLHELARSLQLELNASVATMAP